jgi:hypothetical protein
MALFFVILAIYSGQLMLLLIAGFVFLAGTAELMNVRMREIARADQRAASKRAYTTWQTHVWPSNATYYDQPRPGSFGGGQDVIEADDVRKIQ